MFVDASSSASRKGLSILRDAKVFIYVAVNSYDKKKSVVRKSDFGPFTF